MNGKKFMTCVMLVFVSMGGLMVGFDTGIIGGIENMPDFKNRFSNITDSHTGKRGYSNVRNGLLVAIVNIGTLTGSLLSPFVADRFGKRLCIIGWCCLYLVGNIVQTSIEGYGRWYQLTIGRVVVGIAMGGHSVVVPGYQSECAPSDVRGAIVASYHVSNAFGSFIASLINYGTYTRVGQSSWRIPFGLNFIWCSLLLVGMIFLPESPRYLMAKDRPEECAKVLARLNGVDTNDSSLDVEYLQIEEEVVRDKQLGASQWKELFEPSILYRTALGFAIMSLQQLQGINYFMYYATTIFNGVGIDNPYVAQIIIASINFGGCMIAPFLLDSFGRRGPLCIGGLFNFMCLMVYASIGWTRLYPNGPYEPPNKQAGIVMICFTCFFICSFGLSWAPTAWVVVGETYPARVRSKCASVATAGFWTFNFLIGFFTPFIKSAIGFKYGYIFAACAFTGSFLVFFCAKETKGITLEDIGVLYESNVKPWNSGKWVKQRMAEQKDVGRNIAKSGLDLEQLEHGTRAKVAIEQLEHARKEGTSVPESFNGDTEVPTPDDTLANIESVVQNDSDSVRH